MSDNLRKGLGDQVSEKATPQSQKSYTQVAGENLSGAADKVAGAVQPEGDKSTTQKLGDSTRSGADKGQNQGSGLLDQAKEGLNNAANTISGKTSDASKQ
ncbi:putative chaperone/heat shock protein Hsp12 [Glarea lozoyensis ATCC 20868]|uniref:Putative chaperone/heat shock protein Hsp12 n=2 Tax=Glarea lozoyensis TaxID=101852 RepID=S3CJB7_GLAL2|nr:putative chaperone/heat shock protein Hsp12 [Glarea lozoyensis ATCC 20868]EHL00747.1 putative 12 kDa heat shock protein [Glarea lozoyensis 74030]EPE26617.1 putative chaperone/heat shock protein Hsp12 [Glarea lozoyensis ATCC 20868]